MIDCSNPSVFSFRLTRHGKGKEMLQVLKGGDVIYTHPKFVTMNTGYDLGHTLCSKYRAEYDAKMDHPL